MIKGRLSNSTTNKKVLIWFLLVFLFFFFTIGLSFITLKSDSSIGKLKLVQLFQTIFVFLVPCCIGSYLWSDSPIKWLNLNKKVNWKDLLYIALWILISLPAINMLSYYNQQLLSLPIFDSLNSIFEDMYISQVETLEKFMRAENFGIFLFNVFLMAVIPAISEEIFFRGTLQKFTAQYTNQYIAVWVAGIIFSLVHFDIYGFIPRMLLGVVFGYMYLWSSNLWYNITAHLSNNFYIVLLYYLCQKFDIDSSYIDSIGYGNTLWVGIISIIISCVMIKLLKKRISEQN